ncbi:MAG: heme peroxidase [Bacteroidetes bacterium]|nr:heme peroxidase [Bacteroidota bacterium]
MRRPHGSHIRGMDNNPSSPFFEGVFGRLFRTLRPAHHSDQALNALAAAMLAEFEETPTPEDEIDDEENQGVDAGFTYFGQFIDHDLTFDPASSLQKQNDPNGLIDYRTPKFDLDNLYGRGPDDQPYLYESDGIHFILGPGLTGNDKDPRARSLPRNTPSSGPRRAIIGDPRNDENVIVSQLQASMLRFHNKVADVMIEKNRDVTFTDIHQAVRWHYQYVVLHDFLPTIVGQDMVNSILPHLKSGHSIHQDKPKLTIYSFKKDPFIPIEFSVAAYRFGHSMIRPIYRLNETLTDRQTIFSGDGNRSLNGFREFPSNWAIDWDLFFDPGGAPTIGTNRIQKAYKIDTSLVNPLGDLVIAGIVPGPPHSLILRNLLRGRSFCLPSGQSVARYMGVPVIPDSKLKVGKATEGETEGNPTIVSLAGEFAGNAPLWYYILAEAQQQFKKNDTPIHLGLVGGRIVAEVFIGLMLGDPHSLLSQAPDWQPFEEFQKTVTVDGSEIKEFKIRDLLKAIL